VQRSPGCSTRHYEPNWSKGAGLQATTTADDGGRLGVAKNGNGGTPVKAYVCCRRRRREQATPATSSCPREAPKALLDDGEAVARRIEGGSARISVARRGSSGGG
jgi:hypothetical protein